MEKTFEFRRHSIKDGPTSATIGPKGYALARAVGAAQLRGKGFTDFFVSSFFRTHQTFAAFAEGAGDFMLKLAPAYPPIYVEREDAWALWRFCRGAEIRGEDMMAAALAHDRTLALGLGYEFVSRFVCWARDFADGANVLVVGHSPHLEMLAYALTGTLVPGLRECQGLRIIHDGTTFSLDATSPDLDPSPLRAALFPESK